jgi:hypothetical protein
LIAQAQEDGSLCFREEKWHLHGKPRQWFPLVLGVITALMLVLALVAQTSLGIRRGLIVGAMVLSLSASGLCLYGVYSPIFAIAEFIRE